MSIKPKYSLNSTSETGGYTLAEVMIASAIGSLLAITIVVTTLHMVFSFRAVSNYSTNEQESRNATDWLSRDIRKASSVTQTSTNNLTLSITNTVVTYAYDPVGHTVTRNATNNAIVLLHGCLRAGFTIYQRNALASAYEQFTPGTNSAKLVGYYWHCGVTNVDGTVNTTDAQSALVVMRN
jgi:Tfp pilus assembly protein PilW